jgi:Ca2+-binding RTX toxin-like protein
MATNLNDTLNGTAGADSIDGLGGDDWIATGAGNDTLTGGLGKDTMFGGSGNDYYDVDDVGDVVFEAAGEGTDNVRASVSYSLALAGEVENLLLTGTANINATGNGLDNILIGNAGNNIIDGGAGADLMGGKEGDDTYIIDNVGDVIYDISGNDNARSSVSFDMAKATGVENLALTGTDNINATGNVLDNILIGNSGNNVIDGGAGADLMGGKEGDDTYIIDNVGDVIYDISGNDNARSSVSFDMAKATGVENLALTGTANINATGNVLDNILIGNSGNNVIDGGAGADLMGGKEGNDTYKVDNVGDVIYDISGQDIMSTSVSFDMAKATGVENLYMTGSANNYATGNSLNNRIDGNLGDNIINGGAGNDTLNGWLGADTYVQSGNFGVDTIVDNNSASVDKLLFDSASYNQLWFKQVGVSLEVSVVGTSNKVTVQDWFANAGNQLEQTYDAGAGHILQANKVAGLVAAMSGFAPQDLSTNATLTVARDTAWMTL